MNRNNKEPKKLSKLSDEIIIGKIVDKLARFTYLVDVMTYADSAERINEIEQLFAQLSHPETTANVNLKRYIDDVKTNLTIYFQEETKQK